jgi:hypothetical protein
LEVSSHENCPFYRHRDMNTDYHSILLYFYTPDSCFQVLFGIPERFAGGLITKSQIKTRKTVHTHHCLRLGLQIPLEDHKF